MHFREQKLNANSMKFSSMKHWNVKGNKPRLKGISKMPWLNSFRMNCGKGKRISFDVLKSYGRKLNVPVYNSGNLKINNSHLDVTPMLSLMCVLVWEVWMQYALNVEHYTLNLRSSLHLPVL